MLTWSGWSEVPGNGTTNTSLGGAGISTSSGSRYYLFARGVNDDRIYANWTSDFKKWSNWSEVAGGGKTKSAIAAATFGYRLYIFVRGLDGHVYVNSMDDVNQTWTGWSEVPGGGITDTALAAVRYGSTTVPQLHLFAKGMGDGNPWVNSTSDGKKWTGWRVVPGMSTNLAVTACPSQVDGIGRLYLFCVNNQNNQIYQNSSAQWDYELKSWSGWKPLPGGGQTDAPVVVAPYNLRVYHFVKGLDRRIYVLGTGWQEVPGGGTTDQAPGYISTGSQGNSSEHLYLFVRGDDQKVYMNEGSLPDKYI